MAKQQKPAELVPFPQRASRARKCAVCGRPQTKGHEPFCSRRCADEDLRRWLTGQYRIPTSETPDPEGADDGQA